MGAAAVPALINAGGSIIGGLAGRSASSSASDSQRAAIDRMARAYEEIGMPPETYKPLILKELQQAGILTPELEQEIKLGPSAVSSVKTDQALKEQQLNALKELKDRGGAGLTPEERAQFAKMQQQVGADEESKRQQILQQSAMRGQSGGGQELAAQLLSSQASANQASQAGMELSGQASQRALQAMLQGGQLAGNVQQQQFGQDIQRSQAQDEFNRFNTQNQIAQQSRNIGVKNQSQAANLQNLQNIQNTNVGQYNQELRRQQDARQQYWDSRLRQAQGISGNQQSAAQQYGQQAERTQNAAGTITGGIVNTFTQAYKDKHDMEKDPNFMYSNRKES